MRLVAKSAVACVSPQYKPKYMALAVSPSDGSFANATGYFKGSFEAHKI